MKTLMVVGGFLLVVIGATGYLMCLAGLSDINAGLGGIATMATGVAVGIRGVMIR